jgi:putative flippase GtrA
MIRLLGGASRGRAAVAQGVAYTIGMIVSYVLNRRFSFGGVAHDRATAVRFVVAQLSALGLSASAVQGGVSVLHLHPRLSWLLVSGLVTFYNFNVMRRWVFARAGRRLGSASA